MEKAMALHSSILAWRIPGTVEPGGLPSMAVPPDYLQPMQILVDFYHLIMQPALKKAEETGSEGSHTDG